MEFRRVLFRSIVVSQSRYRVKVQEKPKHTFLGSTDRKGYTLLFTATYYEQIYKYETTIEPFYSEEQKKSIIEEYKEKVKYELAK